MSVVGDGAVKGRERWKGEMDGSKDEMKKGKRRRARRTNG